MNFIDGQKPKMCENNKKNVYCVTSEKFKYICDSSTHNFPFYLSIKFMLHSVCVIKLNTIKVRTNCCLACILWVIFPVFAVVFYS